MIIKTNGTQKEAQVIKMEPTTHPVMRSTLEYDSLKPEETLKDFVGRIKEMVTHYECNQARLVEVENELQDLLHYIEFQDNKNVPEGYKLYKKLADLRRERRICKNENDLLWPVYEHFHATEVLKKLSLVQGEVAKARSGIDMRTYVVRTDVLNEFKKEPPKKAVDSIEGYFGMTETGT